MARDESEEIYGLVVNNSADPFPLIAKAAQCSATYEESSYNDGDSDQCCAFAETTMRIAFRRRTRWPGRRATSASSRRGGVNVHVVVRGSSRRARACCAVMHAGVIESTTFDPAGHQFVTAYRAKRDQAGVSGRRTVESSRYFAYQAQF